MKTANQIYVDNKVRTIITCKDCGAVTKVNAGMSSKTAVSAVERPCRACTPITFPLVGIGWWREFGLDKNSYVYGPMPLLRTSEKYRMEEARRMGWMAWTWQDEYKEERKGSPVKSQKK